MINYYVKTDETGAIIALSSDLALTETDIEAGGWEKIPASIEGEIFKDGVPVYKLKNGKATARTKTEMEAGTLESVVKPLIASKIEESKTMLAAFLAANPITSTAHGGAAAQYSATTEKQSLLTSTMLMAQGAAMAGIPYEITWNAAGQPCEAWALEELQQLAFEIAAYVKPLVSHQQALEMTLNRCATAEAVEAVEIDYSAVLGAA